jgi:hypothetical protein
MISIADNDVNGPTDFVPSGVFGGDRTGQMRPVQLPPK